MQTLISIPYSSIKRKVEQLGTITLVLFQFLIVRLKAHRTLCALMARRFQFLIVRLKVNYNHEEVYIVSISIPYSSIKRRRIFLIAARGSMISIPYSSIKSPAKRASN